MAPLRRRIPRFGMKNQILPGKPFLPYGIDAMSLSCHLQQLLCRKITDSHVAKLDVVRLPVVLEANVTFKRPVFHGSLAQVHVNNLLSIQFDLALTSDAGYDHSIPFSRRSGHILRSGGFRFDNATMIVGG